MDHIDREILQILQHNARASLKMIAEKTFLSSPAVSARIEKLEKDGIITSYQAQICSQSDILNLPVEHFHCRPCHKYRVFFSVPMDQKVSAKKRHSDFIVGKTV